MSALSPQLIRALGQHAAPAQSARTRRRAFTLVEILVVIGIIVLLAAMVVVGITSFLGEGRDDSTRTRMEILNNFMAAYASAQAPRTGGQGNIDAAKLPSVLRAGDPSVTPTPPDGYYSTVDSAADQTAAPAFNRLPLQAPMFVDPPPVPDGLPYGEPPHITDDPTRYPEPFRTDSWIVEPAVARTQAVLRRLLTVPANQAAYANLSQDAKARMGIPDFDGYATLLALEPAIILDGHNNPIIYVPRTGLGGLAFRDGSRNVTLVATNGEAFWASAGPDGIFGFGRAGTGPNATYEAPGDPSSDDVLNPGADDNVYSTTVMRVPTTAPSPPPPPP